MNEIADKSDFLPTGWTRAKIGEMITQDGEFVDGDWVESKDQDENGDVRLIQLADIGDGFYRNKSNRFLTYQKALDLNCTFLKTCDLLLARMPDPLGRCCLFPGDDKKSVTVVDVCIIRPGTGSVSNKCLMYFINCLKFRGQIASLQSGSTRKRISRGNLSTLHLPIPPLPEQHRIVAKIEELFTKLDVAVAELKKAKAQINRYRQSVLKHAFEGKLTEEWRKQTANLPDGKAGVKGETAEELLAKIKEERKKALGKKYKELPPVDTTNLPKLPDGWVWTCLGEIISVSSGDGLTSSKMKSDGNYAVYGGNGISGYYNKYMFEEKKLIIGRVGAKCGVVHITEPYSWVTDNALIVEFNNLDMKFMFYLIHVLNLNQYSVSTAQPVISGAKIYPIVCSISPFDEQQQIVSEIERHFSVADETEKIIDQSLKQAERLRQSILKDAFSGKLVPQDPSDPPASELLAKIKAERERHNDTSKNKRRTGEPAEKSNKSKIKIKSKKKADEGFI